MQSSLSNNAFAILKPDMKRVLEEMQETLELPRFPARIESFDISHIQGAENVAGMVVCENGKMNRIRVSQVQDPLESRALTMLLRCVKP